MLDVRWREINHNKDGSSSLILDATTRSDAGHYMCVASNCVGVVHLVVNLNVTGRPTCMSVRLEIRNEN